MQTSLLLCFCPWFPTGTQWFASVWLNASALCLIRVRLPAKPRLQAPHTPGPSTALSQIGPRLADDLHCPYYSSPRLSIVMCHQAHCVPIMPSAFSDHRNLTCILPFDIGLAVSWSCLESFWFQNDNVLGLRFPSEGRDFCLSHCSIPNAYYIAWIDE